MFSKEQNPQNFDEKETSKLLKLKKQIEELKNNGDVNQYNEWLKAKKSIEYRMMARQLLQTLLQELQPTKRSC